MKNRNASQAKTTRRILSTACAAALALAFTLAHAQPAHARGGVTVPDNTPGQLAPPEGSELVFVGHATGSQNYVCQPKGDGFAFNLFTPEATLFNDDGKQLIHHFNSPNPFEPNTNPRVVAVGTVHPTWQSSKDSSTVWAKLHDNGLVMMDESAIPWLLLDVVKGIDGPDGGDTLTDIKFIQRLSTTGGVAPADECTSLADVGKQAFIPYTADYFFYTFE